ncbi:hypothetical protein [Streptomyces sp. NPDC091217]|uniref:hypothetical protein n=1 Tax=Streptomyces sp. NPDC091217 TaxID=3365975 RepID=UPI0037F7E5E4
MVFIAEDALAASAATLALLRANHQPAPATDPVAYSTTADTTTPATPATAASSAPLSTTPYMPY